MPTESIVTCGPRDYKAIFSTDNLIIDRHADGAACFRLNQSNKGGIAGLITHHVEHIRKKLGAGLNAVFAQKSPVREESERLCNLEVGSVLWSN